MVEEVFNTTSGFLETRWEGETTLVEIIDYIRRTKANTEYPRRLKILTQAEKAELSLTLDDLYEISRENMLSVEKYEVIIDAFIVDAAMVAALTTMYQKVSSIRSYYFKVFSTSEAAINWLQGF